MLNLSSKKVFTELYDPTMLDKLTVPRLKAFRRKLYRYEIGFYCCEFQCELIINETNQKQYDTYIENMTRVNKALWRQTKDD